jgi:hypothetical protein
MGGSGGTPPPADTTKVARKAAATTKTRTTAPPPAVTSGPLHGDPIPPPPPAAAPKTEVKPPTEEKRQCPHISNGVQCRKFAGHDPSQHVYGGGMGDPVQPRHCDDAAAHEAHAWPYNGVMVACSGEKLSEGDGSPDDVAATGTDDEYQRMVDEQAARGEIAYDHEPDDGSNGPTPETATGPVPDAPKPMIAAQTKALQARFKGLGWTDEPDDRESRLRVVSTILGRAEDNQVETFRSGMAGAGGMSYDEAQTVLTEMAPCRSRDDVLELLVRITRALAEPDDEEQTP